MKTEKLPLLVKKTKGNYIILEDNTKLLDGISSWWSACHGYNHPHIIKTIAKQLKKMPHVMFAGLANKPAYQLAERLSKFINHNNQKLTKVFYSDSGSTAVEVAMKIAVQFFINQNKTKKTKIISFNNGYHGDTMGGMSLADPKAGMHAKFKHYLPTQLITKLPKTPTDFNKFENFILKNQEKSAALIIEPLVQCAGGMKFHSPKQLEKITRIAQKHNILVIFDECATGFYRTGSKFAFHQTEITPDILIIGKALTGGSMTLAATITTDKIFFQFLDNSLDKALMHGPTFMGNPLACSAANASLDLFEKVNYAKKTKDIEKIFKTELEQLKNHILVKETRVLGATAIIELKKEDWQLMFQLREEFLTKQIWLRPFSNIIYFMPPLTISKREIQKLVQTVINTLDKK